MAKDILTEEEWESGEFKRPVPPQRVKRPSTGGSGGGGGTLKDYVIVALIAIIAVMGINNFIYARTAPGGGFGGGGGGCCGSGGGGGAASVSNAELEQLGLQYYFNATGDEDVDSVTARVQDFGCHQEIYIYKDGQQVMRVGYGNGQVYQM